MLTRTLKVKIYNPHVCREKPMDLLRMRNGYRVLKKTHHEYYCNFVTTALGPHKKCDFSTISRSLVALHTHVRVPGRVSVKNVHYVA
jgi:hypothetical protein